MPRCDLYDLRDLDDANLSQRLSQVPDSPPCSRAYYDPASPPPGRRLSVGYSPEAAGPLDRVGDRLERCEMRLQMAIDSLRRHDPPAAAALARRDRSPSLPPPCRRSRCACDQAPAAGPSGMQLAILILLLVLLGVILAAWADLRSRTRPARYRGYPDDLS